MSDKSDRHSKIPHCYLVPSGRKKLTDETLLLSDARNSAVKLRETVSQPFFRPFGAWVYSTFYPRLAPWAAFLRRFAAQDNQACSTFFLTTELRHSLLGSSPDVYTLGGCGKTRMLSQEPAPGAKAPIDPT